METKKISFGFSKTIKPNVLVQKNQTKEQPKVELIKCFEEKTLKLVVEKEEIAPLVIPMKEGGKTSTALASLVKRRAVLLGEDELETKTNYAKDNNIENKISDGEPQNLEERAARELIAESKNIILQERSAEELVLPVLKPDELPLDGAVEPTLRDYEEIPINEYGKALLRGMGWKEPPKKNNAPIPESPVMRPKGMGLGVDKILKSQPLLVKPEPNEVLQIKRNAFVRILAGKHKGLYGQIEGLDGSSSRAYVKMALSGVKESFNEFLCQPVSKKEYAQYSKVINNQKFQDYKDMENKASTSSHTPEDNNHSSKSKRNCYKETNIKDVMIKHESDNDKYHESRKNQYKPTVTYNSNNELEETYKSRTDTSQKRSNKYSSQNLYEVQKHKNEYSSFRSERKESNLHDSTQRSRERQHHTHKALISRDNSSTSDTSSYDDNSVSRKEPKKSKHKKSKSKSKSKHRRRHSSSTSPDDERSKKHKKKTKKSKRQRSRSR